MNKIDFTLSFSQEICKKCLTSNLHNTKLTCSAGLLLFLATSGTRRLSLVGNLSRFCKLSNVNVCMKVTGIWEVQFHGRPAPHTDCRQLEKKAPAIWRRFENCADCIGGACLQHKTNLILLSTEKDQIYVL